MEGEEASEKRNPPISDGIPQARIHNRNESGKTKKKKKEEEEEGSFLLGSPTFKDLANGRLRCEETGHELPVKEREAYSRSRACRLALIDAAVASMKPPLNVFQQCPLSKSKLVCKLTGDTINKSEEHIWKHISGKRFQNKLEMHEVDGCCFMYTYGSEQKETEKVSSPENVEKKSNKSKKPPKSSIDSSDDTQKMNKDDNASLEENHVDKNSDSEEPDFWTPPAGDRWDFDDGKDRWEASTSSDQEQCEDGLGECDEQHELESMELSMRTKRMSIAVGPSSFASRKKKVKKNTNSS